MDIIATIGVLVFKNNQEVLLVKHGEEAGHPTGIYGLPSGRIEKNESPVAAAKRELEEEAGLKTLETDLIEIPYDFGINEIKRKKGTMMCSWKVFICRKYLGEIGTDGKETIPEWVKISDLSKYWKIGNLETAVKEGLKYIHNS